MAVVVHGRGPGLPTTNTVGAGGSMRSGNSTHSCRYATTWSAHSTRGNSVIMACWGGDEPAVWFSATSLLSATRPISRSGACAASSAEHAVALIESFRSISGRAASRRQIVLMDSDYTEAPSSAAGMLWNSDTRRSCICGNSPISERKSSTNVAYLLVGDQASGRVAAFLQVRDAGPNRRTDCDERSDFRG